MLIAFSRAVLFLAQHMPQSQTPVKRNPHTPQKKRKAAHFQPIFGRFAEDFTRIFRDRLARENIQMGELQDVVHCPG
jgi:hypothetical protein